MHKVSDFYPDRHGLQICLPLKTSGLGLMKDWLGTPLQLILLIKCSMDLNQHGMSNPFQSTQTSSTKCLNGPVVKISDHSRHVMNSSPVPLKTHRVGQRGTLNLSRTETSSRWCGS
ncbi:hypothetical protein TNCV_581691 [Trichonephila clavipes]|nr:hypothetical protein TNCV_581691 [Trichonephila clavipes]